MITNSEERRALRARLDKEDREEKERLKQEELQKLVSERQKKAFLFVYKNSMTLVYYRTIERDFSFDENIIWSGERLFVMDDQTKATRKSFGLDFWMQHENIHARNMDDELYLQARYEIPVKQFRALKKLFQARLAGNWAIFQEAVGQATADNAQHPVTYEEPVTTVLDFPHCELTPAEVRILEKTPYIVQPNRYLLTDSSRKLGIQIVKQQSQQLESGKAYWEECDMEYVRSERCHLEELRQKLSAPATVGSVVSIDE